MRKLIFALFAFQASIVHGQAFVGTYARQVAPPDKNRITRALSTRLAGVRLRQRDAAEVVRKPGTQVFAIWTSKARPSL